MNRRRSERKHSRPPRDPHPPDAIGPPTGESDERPLDVTESRKLAAPDTDAPTLRSSRAPAGGPPVTMDTDYRGGATRGDGGIRRFQIGDELGRGGMGVVLAAEDPQLRRQLAIKVLTHTDTDTIDRFVEEAQITGQLQHPNIIPVYELGYDPQGRPFLAMKRVHGRTFADVIRDAHRAATRADAIERARRRLLDVFLRVCDGVAYAHSCGVIHRDLKPNNVMVGRFGEVLVVDWGLARPVDQPDAPPDGPPRNRRGSSSVSSDRREHGDHTLVGQIRGTPGFMPPEQALGQPTDEGADIHALGGILYCALTGQLPITGDSPEERLQAALEHHIDRPSERVRGRRSAWVPHELEAVVTRAMARRRRDRYATVGDLQADIERHLDGRLVEAARYSPWQRLAKWAVRHRTAVIGAMSTLTTLMIAVAVVAVLWSANQASEERARTLEAEKTAERARGDAARQAQAFAAERAEIAEKQARERQAMVDAMRAGDFEHVLGLLGEQVQRSRDQILAGFLTDWLAARERGLWFEAYVNNLTPETVREYLEVFDSLFRAHRRHGVEVQADDWFWSGVLRGSDSVNDHAGAIADFNRALALRPQDDMTFNNRGLSRVALGDRAGAMEDFNRAIEINPDNALALHNRGGLHFENRRPDLALTDFARAVELRPRIPDFHVACAQARMRSGDADGAAANLDHALRQSPDNVPALTVRAELRRLTGDARGALDDANRALGLDDRNIRAWNERAMARAALGDFEGAVADYDASLALDPDQPLVWDNRGSTLTQAGRPRDAVASHTRAIQMKPDFAIAFHNRAMAHRELEDFRAAITDSRQAVQFAPDLWQGWAVLALSLEEVGSHDDAVAAMQQAWRVAPAGGRPQVEELLHELGADKPGD